MTTTTLLDLDDHLRGRWKCLTANLAKLVDAHHAGRYDEADQAATRARAIAAELGVPLSPWWPGVDWPRPGVDQ